MNREASRAAFYNRTHNFNNQHPESIRYSNTEQPCMLSMDLYKYSLVKFNLAVKRIILMKIYYQPFAAPKR